MTTSDFGLREQILSVGKKLFIQHGYHGLAMRQISEAVGVSKAALYYHFKDKEELFVAILESNLGQMESQIELIHLKPISCSDKIAQFMEYVLNEPTEQRAIIRLASQEISQLSMEIRKSFAESYHEKFTGKIQKIFLDGIDAGEFRSIDPAVATWALLGMMYPYFYPADTGAKAVNSEVIQQVIDIYLSGVIKSS